uniref:DUF2232 domain-containing protein n=1 Tax=uncultured Thiotrichaceae bacterium TaxID=298394 RepID=A0A6S6UE82_9GAMM|nr:MAG: Unknown protein [uncultured Thiotrichaceae bacterium]
MAAFIMASPLQAFAFVVLFALTGLFMPLIGLLSNAAIGLIALRRGAGNSLKIAAAAGLCVGILILLIKQQAIAALGSTLVQWGAVIALAVLLQQSTSWHRVLSALFVLSVAIIIVFHASVNDAGEFWKEMLQPMVEMPMLKEQFPGIDLQNAVDSIARFTTGFLVAALNLGLIVSLMIARHWQAMLYNPGGFREEFRELSIDKSFGLAMIVLITIGLFSDIPLVIDIIIAGMMIFLFQGVALIHGVHNTLKLHIGWLIGFYVTLLLMPAQLGILLSAFGIIDSIANFRGAIANRKA